MAYQYQKRWFSKNLNILINCTTILNIAMLYYTKKKATLKTPSLLKPSWKCPETPYFQATEAVHLSWPLIKWSTIWKASCAGIKINSGQTGDLPHFHLEKHLFILVGFGKYLKTSTFWVSQSNLLYNNILWNYQYKKVKLAPQLDNFNISILKLWKAIQKL